MLGKVYLLLGHFDPEKKIPGFTIFHLDRGDAGDGFHG